MRVNWSTFDKGKSATNHPRYWFLIIVHIIFTCFIYCLKLNFSTYLWCSIWISLDDLSFCLFKRSFIFPSLIYRLKFAKKKKRNIYIVQTAISHNIELYIANKKKKKLYTVIFPSSKAWQAALGASLFQVEIFSLLLNFFCLERWNAESRSIF